MDSDAFIEKGIKSMMDERRQNESDRSTASGKGGYY